jgi:uncharacterized protein (TIGR04255 family)
MEEVYPNAPLVEAIFEIRFPPVLAIESLRHEFQAAVKDEFPVVYFPVIQPGEASSLRPYHFLSPDGARRLMLSVTNIAYSSKNYREFSTFKLQTLEHLESIIRQYGIGDLTRTGLRYTNILPFVREDGLVPLARYFRLTLSLDGFSHFELRTIVPQVSGNIFVRIEQTVSTDQTQEAFLLDFDYAKQGQLNTKNLSEYLDESHECTKRFFEHLITDDYRKIMRGEIIS